MRRQLSAIWDWIFVILVVMLLAGHSRAQQEVNGTWQIYFIDVQQPRTFDPSDVPPWTPTLTEDMGITIDDKKVVIRSGNVKTEFDLELRANDKNTGEITLSKTDSNGKKQTLPGIYKLEGKKLGICLGLDGQRPKTFEIKFNEQKALIGAEKK
jgi:uncharacterized protein (TIGR03067 family)